MTGTPDPLSRCDFRRGADCEILCIGRDAAGNSGGIVAPGATRAMAYAEYVSRFADEADLDAHERDEEAMLDRELES